jgi:hypothetical protein
MYALSNHLRKYRYFSHCTTDAILFTDMGFIYYENLIKIFRVDFRINLHLLFWGPSEGPLFYKLECQRSPGTDLGWINS